MASDPNTAPETIIECPSCGARARAPTDLYGKTVACRKCGAIFLVKSPSGPATSSPRPPSPKENAIFDGGSSSFIGETAEKFGYVTSEEVQETLLLQRRIQEEEGKRILLGQLMVQRGLITEEQLKLILLLQEMKKTRSRDRDFGALAVKRRYASEKEVEEALGIQRKAFVEEKQVILVGDILVQQAVMTPEQRDALLKEQGRTSPPSSGKDGQDDATEDAKPALALRVSDDHMTVHLLLEGIDPADVTGEGLRDLIASHKIAFGMIPEKEILQQVNHPDGSPKEILLAAGQAPVAGKDAKVTYFFETHPLKAGKVTEKGTVDFKDRGAIPHVQAGALLARKDPTGPGKPGRDVFSKVIPAPKPKDLKLRCGKGATHSEDGLEVHAALDGEPILAPDGKISVFPLRKIQGDVGLKTGHVEFDGAVEVTGSVQDGFRVTCGRLATAEILRTAVRTEGDTTVRGGVIGATVTCGGTFRAKYVQGAHVHALGDVVVEKEIIDSEIITSGGFFMPRGTLLNSRISAKKGIDAAQIGSEGSRPCRLQVGIDESALTKIAELEEKKQRNAERRKRLLKASHKLEECGAGMLPEITELAQVQDRGTLRLRELDEALKQGGEGTSGRDRAAALREKEVLAPKVEKAAGRLEELMDLQDRIEARRDALGTRVTEIEAENEGIKEDIEGIEEWSRASPGAAIVRVRQHIFSHTEIRGPHCLVLMKGDRGPCVIREEMDQGKEGKKAAWKMVVAKGQAPTP